MNSYGIYFGFFDFILIFFYWFFGFSFSLVLLIKTGLVRTKVIGEQGLSFITDSLMAATIIR